MRTSRSRCHPEAVGARRTTQPAGIDLAGADDAGSFDACSDTAGTGAGAEVDSEDAAIIERGQPITGFRAGLGCSPPESSIVTLAHISDLHATRVHVDGVAPLLSKRALGWLSWQLRRRHRYRPAVFEALLDDLARMAPDQIAVTGDFTQISLEEEFREAARWLARIGPPERVSAIPGNHDAYVAGSAERGWCSWSDYLASDAEAAAHGGDPDVPFPSLRLRDGLALVGVCTAQPTLPLLASGRVGAQQLARVDHLLERLGDEQRCRVVLIHHPPLPGVTSWRRALHDARDFAAVLRRRGAELVLHGHLHRTHVGSLPGPAGPIPVVGVPSASHGGPSPDRAAGYHLYDIEPARPGRFAIRCRARIWDPVARRFTARGDASGALLT